MKVSELQTKDVVNISDGKKLGVIGDLDLDLDNGMVRSIVVPGPGRFFGLLGGGSDFTIPWSQIVKIGSDVVLVELHTSPESGYISVKRENSSGGF